MPGMAKLGNIVLKRGIVAGVNEFYDWLKAIKLNQVERRDITISLLNEKHQPAMVWKVSNAFPVKIQAPSLKATGNELAIETLEIAHGGFTHLADRRLRGSFWPPLAKRHQPQPGDLQGHRLSAINLRKQLAWYCLSDQAEWPNDRFDHSVFPVSHQHCRLGTYPVGRKLAVAQASAQPWQRA